ncbi:hypothetical protein [Leisingera sp.]|uniref:hypothetical protein n=1 Tax=Leisingera sp. TaxID=1879318 RepID=UPI002B27544A|nr:hypothetical protein [Leisingera sp.]
MALSTREDKVSHALLWVRAKNRSTGQEETMGLWSGDDVQVLNVNGEDRTYYGPAIISMPPIEGGVGLDVRQHRVVVPHLTPEVITMLREYEPKLAPVEIHFADLSTDTRELLSLKRVFKGWINTAPIETPSEGGGGQAEVALVSAARALTKTLALYRSHADQQKRNATDRFREYSSTTGLKEVWWGAAKTQGGQ